MTNVPQLISPFEGKFSLKNRVVLAPMTRARASANRMPNALMAEYYAQRAGAGLIITEATSISLQGNGWVNTPGIYTDEQAEAWNLPDFKGSLFADVQIDKNWFAGASLFYVGERMDQTQIIDPFIPSSPAMVVLDSYFDANAHLGYRINDRWSVFAKANNIANQDYQRWSNYQVQGLQFLAGATYKFDF